MSNYIDRDKALAETWRNPSYTDPMNVLTEIRDRLRALPAADVMEVVRCKDCKHRPFDSEATQGFRVEFPDEKCPCQCDDSWYNWRPNNDWFCADGERRTDGEIH